MVDPINVTDLTQVGRAQVLNKTPEPVSLNYNADFTNPANIVFNFATINQQKVFGVPKTVFVDNGNNPNPVIVSVSITNQGFSVPAYAQGRFALDATTNSEISFVTDGGSSDKTKIVLYNYELPPVVWYSYGTFNNDKPVMVDGAMTELSDVASSANNNPVYIGGIDRATGLFHGIAVDAQGRLDFSSTITIGAVYGVDAVGVAPTQAPVLVAPLDNTGDVGSFNTNAGGELKVHDASVVSEIANPDNSAITTVAAAIVSTLVLAANTNRKGAVLYNNSSSVVNVSFSNVNAVTTPSIILAAYGSITLQSNDYTGQINAAWGTATGSMLVTEFS